MPKIVDHDERRRQIADAVLELAVSEGLEAATLRRVAAEAGVSMGTVQHYFTDKEEMLTVAFQRMAEARAARILAAVDRHGHDPAIKPVLRTVIMEVLPLTPQSRFEALVGAAYYIRGTGHPPTLELMSAGPRRLIRLLRRLLTIARDQQQLPAGTDPRLEAEILWALMEPASVIAGYRSKSATIAMVDYHLDRLFGE